MSQPSLPQRQLFLLWSLILVFFTSGCIFPSWEETEHVLVITKVDSSYSSPIGNLTRGDASTIPVLLSALDESATFAVNESKEFELTEDEMDQISQLFSLLELPLKEEHGYPWYISFEASLFEISLLTRLTIYN
ncbi:MAG: hypothetical protein ACFFDT_18100 [Candidatus Hodarchaeota archaeon]